MTPQFLAFGTWAVFAIISVKALKDYFGGSDK